MRVKVKVTFQSEYSSVLSTSVHHVGSRVLTIFWMVLSNHISVKSINLGNFIRSFGIVMQALSNITFPCPIIIQVAGKLRQQLTCSGGILIPLTHDRYQAKIYISLVMKIPDFFCWKWTSIVQNTEVTHVVDKPIEYAAVSGAEHNNMNGKASNPLDWCPNIAYHEADVAADPLRALTGCSDHRPL